MARILDLTFPLPGGLHARPASALVEAVRPFACSVTLANLRTGRSANVRSTLALVATATRHGDPCRLSLEGADEAVAADSVERFLATGFLATDGLPPTAPPEEGAPLPRALASDRVLRGVAAGPGLARAAVVVLANAAAVGDPPALGGVEQELAALGRTFDAAGQELRGRAAGAATPTERAILGCHLDLLEDVELRAEIERAVHAGQPAGVAVRAAREHFAAVLRGSGSALLAGRALDLDEVAAALLVALGGRREPVVLTGDAVVVAEELGPAVLLTLDRTRVKALVLGQGGATCHAAIVARAGGLPCVAGLQGIASLEAGVDVVVDGGRGLVVITPSPAALRFYTAEHELAVERVARLALFRERRGKTADGRRLEVAANAASVDDVHAAVAAGAEGIGLLRTELQFADSATPPSEEDQTAAYAQAARAAAGRPVIVRTLDVGGDKALPFLPLEPEANPFLGVRGVRLYREHEALIATQVRAVLRASAHGRLRMMVPMVTTVAEVRDVRELVEREKNALRSAGVPFDESLQVGIMVEVPAAALAVDRLAEVSDFFSIGSNDLLQYTLAADRGNPRLAALSTPLHPAFLRLLDPAVADARARGRWIGLCGEMAGDERVLPLLVGLGLDEVSVAPPLVARVKAGLAACDSAACRALLERAMAADGPEAVASLLEGATRTEARLASADTIRLRSTAADKVEAIRELVRSLELVGRIGNADVVEDAVWRREVTGSTSVGLGVAVPHCASAQVRAASLALARYKTPLDWGGDDGSGVRLAILIAVPADAGERHLRLIAALSRRLMDDDFRHALLDVADEAEAAALLSAAAGEGNA